MCVSCLFPLYQATNLAAASRMFFRGEWPLNKAELDGYLTFLTRLRMANDDVACGMRYQQSLLKEQQGIISQNQMDEDLGTRPDEYLVGTEGGDWSTARDNLDLVTYGS